MRSIAAKRIKPTRRITAGFLAATARFIGDLVNLSESGVLIRCPLIIQLETMGHLGIDIGRGETLRAVAVVRRQVPGIGLAFQFTQMRPRDRELLRKLLHSLGRELLA